MTTPPNEDPRSATLLELRARQLLVHGLLQRDDGDDGLGDAIDAACHDVDPADAFARALGLLFTTLRRGGVAELVAEKIRAGIPPLLLKLERRQDD